MQISMPVSLWSKKIFAYCISEIMDYGLIAYYFPSCNAGEWWENYGLQCPTLQKMALRILNLTSSSSGCERNWSTFEMVTLNLSIVNCHLSCVVVYAFFVELVPTKYV